MWAAIRLIPIGQGECHQHMRGDVKDSSREKLRRKRKIIGQGSGMYGIVYQLDSEERQGIVQLSRQFPQYTTQHRYCGMSGCAKRKSRAVRCAIVCSQSHHIAVKQLTSVSMES